MIQKALEKVALDDEYLSYIMTMLKSRHPDIPVNLNMGVPQGDPLSMLLFVVAINPIIEKLQSIYGNDNVVAYADDIMVKRKGHNFDDTEINKIATLFQNHGLGKDNKD